MCRGVLGQKCVCTKVCVRINVRAQRALHCAKLLPANFDQNNKNSNNRNSQAFFKDVQTTGSASLIVTPQTRELFPPKGGQESRGPQKVFTAVGKGQASFTWDVSRIASLLQFVDTVVPGCGTQRVTRQT